MSAECDELRQEIERLRQAINGLQGRYMLATERQPIKEAIAQAQSTADNAAALAVSASAAAAAAAATAVTAKSDAAGAVGEAASALSIAKAVEAGLTFVLNQMRAYVTRERFSALENRLNLIERGLDILTRLAGTLNNRISANRGRIDALEASVRSLLSQISVIFGQIAGLRQQLASLAVDVRQNAVDITSLKNRLAFLEQKVEANRQSILDALALAREALNKAIENGRQILLLQATVAGLVATVAALGATVAGLAATVAALAKAVGVLTAGLARLAAMVARLLAQVAKNTAAIARNSALILRLRAQLTRLASRLFQLESLARSALQRANLAVELALLALRRVRSGLSLRPNINITGGSNVADSADLQQLLALAREARSVNYKTLSVSIGNSQKLAGAGGGTIDLSPCIPIETEEGDESDGVAELSADYGGSGLVGIYSAISALARAIETIHSNTKCSDAASSDSDWPVTLPQLLTQETEETTEITGLPQAIAWFAKNLDALSGQYPITLEIEDTDPITRGNQSETIALPNQAEAMAELFGLAYEANTNSELAVNMLFRLIPEVIAAKNSSLTAQDYSQAISNWLGFRVKNVEREIDSNFNPLSPNSLTDFLSASKYKIQGVEDDDPHTLVEWIQQIKYATAIVKASVFRGAGQESNLTEEIQSVTDNQSADSGEAWEKFVDALNRAESNLTDRSVAPRPRATSVDDVLNPGTILPDRDPAETN